MALTYRTGSGGKGSALTIEELDNNFRHFTGSHTVSGSVTISGSVNISGSIIPSEEEATLGSAAHPWKEVFASNNSFKLISGSGASLATASISFNDGRIDFSAVSGSALTGSVSGSVTGSGTGSWNGDMSGSFTGSYTGSGTGSWDGDMSGSFTGSYTGSGTGSWDGDMSGSFTGSYTGSGTGSWDGDLTGSFTGSGTGSFDGNFTGSFTGSGVITGSFTGSVDSQFNSGSCLIGCTSSTAPTHVAQEGTFVFVTSASINHIYVYLGGGWRSGSLSETPLP
jgi:hypothetical protein